MSHCLFPSFCPYRPTQTPEGQAVFSNLNSLLCRRWGRWGAPAPPNPSPTPRAGGTTSSVTRRRTARTATMRNRTSALSERPEGKYKEPLRILRMKNEENPRTMRRSVGPTWSHWYFFVLWWRVGLSVVLKESGSEKWNFFKKKKQTWILANQNCAIFCT